MGRSFLRVTLALLLAFAFATAATVALQLPPLGEGRSGFSMNGLAQTGLCVTALALPLAMLTIVLGETRRIRGLPYWAGAGLLVSILGIGALSFLKAGHAAAWRNTYDPGMFALVGLVSGGIYWFVAGRRSGRLMAAIERPSSPPLSERRCIGCTLATLALGFVPLVLIGSTTIYSLGEPLAPSLQRRAEAEAKTKLANAGLPDLAFKIDGDTGTVIGKSAAGNKRGEAFASASLALAPLVGFPGVVARLKNGISGGNAAEDRH